MHAILCVCACVCWCKSHKHTQHLLPYFYCRLNIWTPEKRTIKMKWIRFRLLGLVVASLSLNRTFLVFGVSTAFYIGNQPAFCCTKDANKFVPLGIQFENVFLILIWKRFVFNWIKVWLCLLSLVWLRSCSLSENNNCNAFALHAMPLDANVFIAICFCYFICESSKTFKVHFVPLAHALGKTFCCFSAFFGRRRKRRKSHHSVWSDFIRC